MFDLAQLEAAAETVHRVMPPTPQYAWPLLGLRTGAEVWVKHENHTPAGAFKVRGGIVFMDEWKKSGRLANGFISATKGNHGQSIAFAGTRAGYPVTIVTPVGNNPETTAAMRGFGADVIEHGEDFEAARLHSIALAQERGLQNIGPFEPWLTRGVATYALEFFRAVDGLDTVYVPVGQGSGICATILARDLLGLETKVVGVVAEGAPCHALSFAAGRIVTTDTVDTFADGVATRVPQELPLEIMLKGADRFVTVSDAEIAFAMRAYWQDTHNIACGAGSAPLAALLKEHETMRGRKVGLILSGGNIQLPLFLELMRRTQQAA
jgi:threonine dehydratase